MSHGQDVRRVDLRTGVTVAYAEQGDPAGPHVLLLHAWAESLRCFDRLMRRLPSSVHVVAMDQRGHGDADKPADGYDLASLAADVEAFMDAVGLASVVLVGSSSGGYVAQRAALRIPDRVGGLVLVGAPRTLQGRATFADEVDRLTDPVDPTWARRFLSWFPLRHEVPEWYLDDRVHDALRVPADVWRSSLTGLTTSPAPTDEGTISAPTLILWGDRDPLLAREEQEALAARIPASTLHVYEGVGHLVLWEQPERVAADVTDFVADTRR
jgi:pimeloyl-ACP methyl ester carboxylesterase